MTGRRQLEPKGRGAENGRLKVDDGVQEKKPESWEIGRQTSDGRGQKLEVVTIEK